MYAGTWLSLVRSSRVFSEKAAQRRPTLLRRCAKEFSLLRKSPQEISLFEEISFICNIVSISKEIHSDRYNYFTTKNSGEMMSYTTLRPNAKAGDIKPHQSPRHYNSQESGLCVVWYGVWSFSDDTLFRYLSVVDLVVWNPPNIGEPPQPRTLLRETMIQYHRRLLTIII